MTKQIKTSCTEKYSASWLVSVCLDSPYPVINKAMHHRLIASVSFWPPLDLFQADFGLHWKTPNEVRPSQMSSALFRMYVLRFDFQF